MEIAASLRDLVRTMKTLAAVSVRRYERAVVALNDYGDTVELGLRAALHGAPPVPARPPRGAAGRHGLLVLGSDQGLCGTFNEQVVTRLRADLDAGGPDLGRVRLYAVGARVASRLREAGLVPEGETTLPVSTSLVSSLVQDLLVLIDGWRSDGDLDGVSLYHNRPLGSSATRPHRTVLLPVTERLEALRVEPWPTRALPMLTMQRPALISALTRQHLFVTLHRALVFSLMAEHTSRLLAMQAAERNIDERLDALTSHYQTERQTMITAELLDIVSGTEALIHSAA